MPARRTLALLFGLAASLLLAWNTALRPVPRLQDQRGDRRYWEDVAIGTSRFLHRHASDDVVSVRIASPEGTDLRDGYKRQLIRAVEEGEIQPWEFWRTVPIRRFLQRERVLPRDYDDPGRPALIGLGFRLLGGVAPFLGLWLGALCAVPVLCWLALELASAGRIVAAALLPLSVAASSHVVDALSLSYSAEGFYLIAVLLLAPLAVYALLGDSRSAAGLALRLALSGLGFALCVLCRGSVLGLLPAYLITVVLAARRALAPASATRAAALALAALALFLLPYAALRQSGHHAVWGDIWEGLGDFDTSKGHTWADPALRDLLRSEGMRLHKNVGVEFESDESERITRAIVVRHVTEDPLWFAEILAKRTFATLTQWKLWAWEPEGRWTFHPTTRPNEGTIDVYYKMAATADVFGVGSWRLEVPMPLLLAPTALLLAVWLGSLGVARLAPWRGRLGRPLAVLGLMTVAAAALPIVITTGALEMQAFVLVYLLGLAFAADVLLRRRLSQGQ